MLWRPILLLSIAVISLPAQSTAPVNYDPAKADPVVSTGILPRGVAYQPLTAQQRWRLYVSQSYGNPGVYARAAMIAGFDHSGAKPKEWGGGSGPYARRLGDRFARFAMQDSIEAGGAALLGQDVRYIRSRKDTFHGRLGDAILMNFRTYNKQGRWVPAVPKIAAGVASEVIANQWHPASRPANLEVARDALIMQVAFGSFFNVLLEFGPDLKKRLRWKKK